MSDGLIRALSRLKGTRVLVLGDVMLDEHVWSKVNRISPEAPVPVAEVTSVTYAPGGAANVASNIRALGGNARLVGVVGADANGEKLRKALREKGVVSKLLVTEPGRATTFKSRIIAHGQQVVRVDCEDKKPIDGPTATKVLEVVASELKEADAVLISDYAKGVITPEIARKVIATARAAGKIVCIDPKGKDYGKYHGATVITPNQREAEEATGVPILSEDDAVAAGKKLLHDLDLAYVLITRGERGMSLAAKDGTVSHVPAVATQVYDVTGAGDTAIAALTLALASGIGIEDAVKLSNRSAGIVVRKVGTVVATAEEVEQELRRSMGPWSNRKVASLKELGKTLRPLREAGKKIVFTNGCFDIIHLGHVTYLREAKELGDILIVGVNSDSSVKKIKGAGRPILPEDDRAQIVAALESVDYVVIFPETTPKRLIQVLKPDIHVKGGDYQPGDLPEAETVAAYGGRIVIASNVEGKSTSVILNQIAKRTLQCRE